MWVISNRRVTLNYAVASIPLSITSSSYDPTVTTAMYSIDQHFPKRELLILTYKPTQILYTQTNARKWQS
jgi:hypothetical protein